MSRDDQFAGFASRLLQELLDQGAYVAISEWATGGDSLKSERLIAQRAYDLVAHTIDKTLNLAGDWSDPISIIADDGFVQRIPDLTTLPEETN